MSAGSAQILRLTISETIATSAVASHLGIHYPSDPGIKYRYPPANGDILLNISSALAAVPRFYVQVSVNSIYSHVVK